MKHKFSSMGRVAIALVLALSLCLVMAVPAAVMGQGSSNYTGIVFAETGTAAVEWSTGAPEGFNGAYTVELHPNVGWENMAKLNVIYSEPLADFAYDDLVFTYHTIAADSPFAGLYLDTTGDGMVDYGLGSPSVVVTEGAIGEWQTAHPYDSWRGCFEGTQEGDNLTLDELKLLDSYGPNSKNIRDATIVYVAFEYGNIDSVLYVDDFTIKGVTYEMEPMVLDAEFYETDAVATVKVLNGNVSDQVQVGLASTLAGHSINIWASEDSGNPGVFEGSFTLVDSWTGINQLLVLDGDTITATYTNGDWGAGPQTVEVSAGVDDTDPVVAITAPEAGDFVAGEVSITWTIDETNEDTVAVTIGDDVVEFESGDTWNTLAETIPDVPDWPDGSYTIKVVATDAAGNVGSDSIDVTVDNTAPVIADQEATPPVVKPNIENTIVFTADVTELNIDTVTINLGSIGGSATEPMLDDGLLSDVEEGDGIYTAEATATLTEEDSPYSLPVTATDLAGNSVTTAGEDLLELVCSSDIVAPVITDAAITYPFVGVDSAQPDDLVTIFATVTDDVEMGSVKAVCDVVTDGTDPIVIDLLDNGVDPDDEADDGIYTGTVTVDSDAGWGDYPVTITATDAKGNVATDESLILAVRYGATGTTIDLVVGWNLISLPLIPSDADITVVISATTLLSADVSSVGIVREYDPATGDFPLYIPGTGGDLTEMEDGVGYWVFMEEADTLTITGRKWPVPPATPPTYDVVVGWNLIGFKSMDNMIDYEAIDDTGYLLNIAGTYPVLWSYNAVFGAYSNVKGVPDGMVVGHGFWIWITEAGTIVPPQ